MNALLTGRETGGRKIMQEPRGSEFSLNVLSELEHEGKVFRDFWKTFLKDTLALSSLQIM